LGLNAAAELLADCPSGATRAVVLVSDGESSAQNITAGLALLESDVRLSIVALDGGSWPSVAAMWGRAGREALVIRRLDAGVVALTLSRIMSELTGRFFATSFDVR